jgi:trehalose synthase-fused probable maltokinase
LAKLPQYLLQQRWFAGKGAPIKQVSILDQTTINEPSGEFVIAIVEVTFQLGNPQRYLLPVRLDAKGEIGDATEDDGFVLFLLRLIHQNRSQPSTGGMIRGERLPGAEKFLEPLPGKGSIRRLKVEQSNTSIVFDDRVILKLIRQLEHGLNPELEMGQFLAQHSGFIAVPRLLGALQFEGSIYTSLGILHQFVRSQGDGWSYALEAIRRTQSPHPDYLGELEKLGQTLGNLHLTLASDPTQAAFAAEPIQQADLQRWSSSIIGELGVTIAAASQAVPGIEDRREALVARAQALARLSPAGQKIRIHGDFHLGQALRGATGWLILDLGGEPTRSFSQRREKQSPLKDVAGMLRSFAYASAAIELEGGKAAQYLRPSRESFLRGYLGVMQMSDLLPPEPDFSIMVDVFEIEKMLYEVRYELQNRPDWVQIPARTLMQTEESSC